MTCRNGSSVDSLVYVRLRTRMAQLSRMYFAAIVVTLLGLRLDEGDNSKP